MCSRNQICLPIAKRLAKPRVAGNRHKLRLTGLSKYVKGPQGLQIVAAQPYVQLACYLAANRLMILIKIKQFFLH